LHNRGLLHAGIGNPLGTVQSIDGLHVPWPFVIAGGLSPQVLFRKGWK